MSSNRYPEEFKIEAVKQLTERGYPVAEVAGQIGVSQHSLYTWIKQYSLPGESRQEQQCQSAETRRLKAELKRVTEERDILKKAAARIAKQTRQAYLLTISSPPDSPDTRILRTQTPT